MNEKMLCMWHNSDRVSSRACAQAGLITDVGRAVSLDDIQGSCARARRLANPVRFIRIRDWLRVHPTIYKVELKVNYSADKKHHLTHDASPRHLSASLMLQTSPPLHPAVSNKALADIADVAPGAQSAATVYDDKIKRRVASW